MECRKPVFQLTVFLKLCFRETVRSLEQIMSADKCPRTNIRAYFAQNRSYCDYHRATHVKKCSQIARCIYVFSKIKSVRLHLKPCFFTRQFRPRPRRLLSSDGKSLLNLWFIPHYTEVKEEHSMGD